MDCLELKAVGTSPGSEVLSLVHSYALVELDLELFLAKGTFIVLGRVVNGFAVPTYYSQVDLPNFH